MNSRSTEDVITGVALLVVSAGAIVEGSVRWWKLSRAGVGWRDPRYRWVKTEILFVLAFIVIAYAHLR